MFLRKDLERTEVELKVNANYTGAARFDGTSYEEAHLQHRSQCVQAMPNGGRFTLTVDREGDELAFTFQDNRPGIPPEMRTSCFSRCHSR